MTPFGTPSGTPADLEAASFGPVEHVVDAARVARFVEATGDATDRWSEAAPPGYAAILLFAVAGALLDDERIRDHTKTLIHVDQQFRYEGPLLLGPYAVSGRVDRVRQRGDVWFVTFTAEAKRAGTPVLTATATFLMSDQPAGVPGADRPEPPVQQKAESHVPPPPVPVAATGPIHPLAKSASRFDLVRYAAATGDFNPIHWDHAAARAAGLDGIVVHGLLLHAWLSQLATTVAPGAAPIATIKTRFRSAVHPGVDALVAGDVVDLGAGHADLKLRLARGAIDMVSSTATVRIGEE